ncbi:MAG: homocysteine S-methyltransferase family protein, partial [Anaerolineae bacterium]|nr:homocysteine S-methyltransferase family protein [Anaerolineae bacterium]
MTESIFDAWLQSATAPLLADGAMGTMLHARGMGPRTCYDELNRVNPALVAEIHRGYIDAGAQIIQTNTFGANRYKLALHGLEDRVIDLNRAGVELARRVIFASFKEVLLAGDVGPLGVRLVPYGRVQLEQAREAFTEQITALVEAGVDLIVIETMTDLREAVEAVKAARQVGDLPVVATMTFTRDDRTLLGDVPEAVARKLWKVGATMIGVNCSGGPVQLLRILQRMRAAVPEGCFWVKPNAGWPEQVGGRIMYPASPEYFGEYTWLFHEAGARVIGGCCGTTPAHIAAMRTALDAGPPAAIPHLNGLVQSLAPVVESAPDEPSRLARKFAAGEFVIAVEMDPPRGLATQKLLAGASLLAEAGTDVINVADSPMARMRMSPWAVCHLVQDKVGIETTLHFPTRGRNLLRVQG